MHHHLSTLLILALSQSLLSSTSTPPSDLVAHLDPRAQAPPAVPAAPVAPAAAAAAPVAPVVAPAVPPVAAPPPAVPAGGAGAAAPAPAAPLPGQQVPTVTTVTINTVVNGVPTYTAIPFTQTFEDVISQGPPPQAGTIGLGTLTGSLKGEATTAG